MSHEIITAIADDGSFYQIEKLDAHRRGILHLAVSVFVFCGDELLLQRRAASKYHSGLLWANTCCSHPVWGETPIAAAHRRIREEVGCDMQLEPGRVLTYTARVSDGLVENELVHVFCGTVDKSTFATSPNPQEVAELRWAALPDIRSNVQNSPNQFAPWFRIYLERWPELGLT
jgi:isopentenyl-diphosphate Delta-isomerase